MERNIKIKIIFTLFLGLICLSVSVQSVRSADCLLYEPEEVKISGIIVRKIFPGPPNYESIEEGDIPETVWILDLKSPVCVLGDEESELNSATVNNVTSVHLNMGLAGYENYKELLFKDVLAYGTLYLAHTGHHRADIVMTVTDLEEVHGETMEP